ncbi:unnamed protein product [Lampetra fluviatilis]
MFTNKRAWFSSSVDKQLVNMWVAKGGQLCSMLSADFLFSDDATSTDTQTIYNSWMYLVHDVTVFHSSYVAACLDSKTFKNISIGHYVLPPAKLHDEIRKKVGAFIWEVNSPPHTKKEISIKRKREKNGFTTKKYLLNDSGVDVTEDTREINNSAQHLNTKGNCCQLKQHNYQLNNLIGSGLLISFDIVSLFTKVPVPNTISIIEDLVQEGLNTDTSLMPVT